MMDSWINFGDGFLLIFAINDEESFKMLEKKRERILKNKLGAPGPILLVGNKQDLDNERQVEYAEAKALADKWKVEYIETSAKTNFNCKEAFERLAVKIVESNKSLVSQRGKCCNVF